MDVPYPERIAVILSVNCKLRFISHKHFIGQHHYKSQSSGTSPVSTHGISSNSVKKQSQVNEFVSHDSTSNTMRITNKFSNCVCCKISKISQRERLRTTLNLAK